ncbi:MAG: MGMT family protein [Candidatus Azambacteria bacterium]|nr:MGMT family protein [Candidatus Azambacteria bacterium]
MTHFEKKVYKAVKKIPKGKTATYKEVAVSVGRPRAWRAVGNILSKNFNPEIPCHRVICSDGKIGDYNRGGSIRKKFLLQKEKSC